MRPLLRLLNIESNFLCNLTLPVWWSILKEVRFRISPRYWYKAALITLLSPANHLFARREKRRFHAHVAGTELVDDPIFILGHWRNGTTHLHNTLSQDERYGFLDTYQSINPETFLLEKLRETRVRFVLPRGKRPMDNIMINDKAPQEEDLSMMLRNASAPGLFLAFPQFGKEYIKQLRFNQEDPDAIARWREEYVHLLKKLTYETGKPLVLKSPTHTGRVKQLLETFPNAKFIHIMRHPQKALVSTLHLHNTLGNALRLQTVSQEALQECIIETYQTMYGHYFADTLGLSPKQLYEVKYEDYIRDPMRHLQEMYERLNLGDFETAAPAFDNYLQSQSDYKTNAYGHDAFLWLDRYRDQLDPFLERWQYTWRSQ